jgi:transcriptional regulator with XRE-family HTH domain
MPINAPDERCLILGKNIRRLRGRNQLSQEKLAEKADIHVSYIGQIERGMRYPSLKTLFKIADVFEVNISSLLKGINANNDGNK